MFDTSFPPEEARSIAPADDIHREMPSFESARDEIGRDSRARGEIWDRLVGFLTGRVATKTPLPAHPANPRKVCLREVARLAGINEFTLEDRQHPNRRLLEFSEGLLGLKRMHEGVGALHLYAQACTDNVDWYLNGLFKQGRRLPGKDGKLNLRAASLEAGLCYSSVASSRRLRDKFEKAVKLLDVEWRPAPSKPRRRRELPARTGPVTV